MNVQTNHVKKDDNGQSIVLIHKSFKEYMPVVLKAEFDSMIRGKKESHTAVFRLLATNLIPDFNIWADNNGEYMRKSYPILEACRSMIFSILL